MLACVMLSGSLYFSAPSILVKFSGIEAVYMNEDRVQIERVADGVRVKVAFPRGIVPTNIHTPEELLKLCTGYTDG